MPPSTDPRPQARGFAVAPSRSRPAPARARRRLLVPTPSARTPPAPQQLGEPRIPPDQLQKRPRRRGAGRGGAGRGGAGRGGATERAAKAERELGTSVCPPGVGLRRRRRPEPGSLRGRGISRRAGGQRRASFSPKDPKNSAEDVQPLLRFIESGKEPKWEGTWVEEHKSRSVDKEWK
ncbi:hypothetical protein P7K49_009874 [Saguinus oedipus]|uniref:Uncharacterized protein n=1 Tax=Saguinus oedipus TaxID=9490 RepID=A0ABQ9VL73_SAGOE|nr:hypothetical protein P7K49_009874 [Saguinus oedipus]